MEIVFKIDGVQVPVEWVDDEGMKEIVINDLTSAIVAKMVICNMAFSKKNKTYVEAKLLFECED